MISFIQRRIARRPDDGFAMMSVLFFMLVVTVLGTSLVALSLSANPESKHEQSYHDSLTAAESGVDDFIDRLDEDYNYATDAPDGNAAFNSCVKVSTSSDGCFQYRIDTSQLDSSGTLYLYSTGKVGSVQRTVKVGLRPYGFLDALSLSDYNLVDPSLDPVYNGSVADTTKYCVYHAWEPNTATGGTGPDMSKCSSLINYWITGNVLDGPMQSNDDFYLCGTPKFTDTVDSGDPSTSNTPYWRDPVGCGGDQPSFADGAIEGQHNVGFPPAATSLKSDTVIGQTGSGCLYTGPTAITVNDNKMTVVSPETVSTNPGCGPGTNLSLPANGTVYVQDQPSSSSDPNYGPCLSVPILTYSGDSCARGDAFVKGNLSGQLTVAADNNIYIAGDVTYSSFSATTPRPVLGLIATNTVEIFHPVSNDGTTCSGHPTDGSGYCNLHSTVNFDTAGTVQYTVPLVNPTVDAAMLSLQHSFAVQNFTLGPAGELGAVNLDGTVAGKFMDIEGVFAGNGQMQNGYGVNYTYDKRFRNGGLVPPNYLDPTQTFWHRISYGDCSQSTSSC